MIYNKKSKSFIDSNMNVFINSDTAGGINNIPITDVKKKFSVDWVFHDDDEVDIAIIPFAASQKDKLLRIPMNLFLTSDNLNELLGVYYISYQPGIQLEHKINPIVRDGTISIIHEDKTFHMNGTVFPGNSGSPVFVKPSAFTTTPTGITLGADKKGNHFIGVVSEYVPYYEEAISPQTGHVRVMFEENTGLTKIWSVDYLNEIISSQKFDDQHQAILKLIEKEKSEKEANRQ